MVLKRRGSKCEITGSEWFNHFNNLLNSESVIDENYWTEVKANMDYHNRICMSCNENLPVDLNKKFTIVEVESFTRKLPNGKAGGLDDLCNEMLKH